MEPSLLPNIYDFIAHTYPFTMLSTLEQDALAARVKISYHQKDEILDSDQICKVGLYMIRTGALEEINRNGSLRSRLGVGDTLGYSQLNKEGESDYTIRFIENTLLYLIDKQVLNFIISRNPSLEQCFDSRDEIRLEATRLLVEKNENTTLFSKPIATMCKTDLARVYAQNTLQETAQSLYLKKSDVAFVMEQNKLLGLVTKSDLTYRALAQGLDYKTPINKIMSTNIISIESSRTVFEALELMISHNIKNLPVLENNELLGLVDAKMLLQNSILQAVYLIKQIKKETSLKNLSLICQKKNEVFLTLARFNLPPKIILEVLSSIADTTLRRLCELAQERLGPAPCNFAFMVAGSQAREETQILSDQDNAIILERGLNDEESTYFTNFASFVCLGLNDCGYKLCDGNYMATNPKFCKSINLWEEQIKNWVSTIDAKSMLDLSVFLEIRPVFGDEFLVKRLQNLIVNTCKESKRFLALLCATCQSTTPPIGVFRQFVLSRDGQDALVFNIKSQAINIVTELARLYGLAAGSLSPKTADRLQAALKAGLIDEETYRELSEATQFLLRMRLEHQKMAIENSKPLSNNIAPDLLSQFEKNHLRDAFRIIARQQDAAAFRFRGLL